MAERIERPRAFGVEEEYQLLDAKSGAPVDRAAELILATPELGKQTEREYFSSQLETATPICREAHEAEESLTAFREAIARAAEPSGVLLAGTGLPPVGGDTAGTVTPKPRYLLIASEVRAAAKYQYATGTHVHVEVPSRDAGVDVIARLARWAPALLALTVNSPLWCGEPTGFASWRHLMGLSWPANAYPSGFDTAEEYDRAIARLIDTRIVPDAGMLSWVIRLSANYPTVELRIADAQLRAGDAVSFAVIVRALVERALRDAEQGVPRPRYTSGIVNGSDWMAARNGLGSELIDPLRAESLPAFELVDRMLGTVGEELDRFGDRERVDAYLRGLRAHGDPASRQLAAFARGGIGALLELYRGGSPDHGDSAPASNEPVPAAS